MLLQKNKDQCSSQDANRGRIFIWDNYSQWRKAVPGLMKDFIGPDVLRELRKNPPRHFVSDNLAWFNEAIWAVKRKELRDVCQTLADRLPKHYAFLRAFHGCRPPSIESYTQKGLLLCDPSSMDEVAFQIFRDPEQVKAAIQKLSEPDSMSSFSYREHNNGKVWFCLEKEELTEYCGHYLLYGSEYLLAVGTRVGEENTLRNIGRATVIECNVPFKDIPEYYVKELAGEILAKIGETYCARLISHDIVGFGFHIETSLAPKHIVKCHFPTGIPNPRRCRIAED